MTKDTRPYVRVALDLPSNGKFDGLSTAARWLYVVGLIIAGRDLTDGHIRRELVQYEAGVKPLAGLQLIQNGAWHSASHDCENCPQPRRGYVYIHDYLEHQRSRSDVLRARSAGRAGANARWNASRTAVRSATANADRNSNARARLEPEPEEEHGLGSQSSDRSSARASDRLSDQDIDKIAQRLRVSRSWATQVADEILNRVITPPTKPGAYVLAAIEREPGRYNPSASAIHPPKLHDTGECPKHPGELAANCRACAADAKAAG